MTESSGASAGLAPAAVADPQAPADDDAHWATLAARAADAKSADDVVVLEVGPVMAVCGYFVIASGGNTRLVRTIAEEVEARLTLAGGPKPLRTEGFDDLRWVLLDYGDFVVHVFVDEARHFYDLERLWSDVPTVRWQAP
ncbi:MAG: ribosome silencing factor [Acidimicrobiales bacterium]